MTSPDRPRPAVLVGTANAHKVREIAAALQGLELDVTSAETLGAAPRVEETGATFEENADLKALAFARAAAALPEAARPRWVLSDDSGLCVEALDGAPGVYSARYAADVHGDAVTDEQNNAKLLAALRDVPETRRGARFVCALALAEVPATPQAPPRVVLRARGECRGRILESPRGEGGFGYDPLFWCPQLDETFGAAPAAEKQRVSHRARALAELRERLASEVLG